MTTNLKPTATVRRYTGDFENLQMERDIVTPLDLYIDSFKECWPFHRVIHYTGITSLCVETYSTAERYEKKRPDYNFIITPLS